jgi:hypothetical protein
VVQSPAKVVCKAPKANKEAAKTVRVLRLFIKSP